MTKRKDTTIARKRREKKEERERIKALYADTRQEPISEREAYVVPYILKASLILIDQTIAQFGWFHRGLTMGSVAAWASGKRRPSKAELRILLHALEREGMKVEIGYRDVTLTWQPLLMRYE